MRSLYPTGSRWRRAIESLRHEGPKTFAIKLASELGYRRVLLLERALDDSIPDPPRAEGVVFERLGVDRVDEYRAFRRDAGQDRIDAQLASGHECYVLRQDGRIVSSCLASTRPQLSAFLGTPIPVGEGDVYLSDAWTDPASRGHSHAHVLCLHQLRHFRDLGSRRAVRATVPENRSALRAHAKSGFRPFGVLGTLRIGPWQREFRRPWRGDFP